MRKFLIMTIAALAFTGGVQKVFGDDSQYLYWMLTANEEDPVEFLYAMLAVEGEGVDKYYLTLGDTSEEIVFGKGVLDDLPNLQPATSTEEVYSRIVMPDGDTTGLELFVELYGLDGTLVGLSETAKLTELWSATYDDMSTTGIRMPYRFTGSAPEPSGGILVLLGLCALALKRRTER